MNAPLANDLTEPSLDESIIDAIPSPVAAIDPKGRVLRFNHAFEQLTGFSKSDVLGRPLWQFVAREKVEAQQAWVTQGILHGQVPPMESDLLGRDGVRRRIRWNLAVCQGEPQKPRCIVLTGIEVARGVDELVHQQTEEALRESEERFRVAFKDAAVGMAIGDLRGRFLQANAAYCTLTGYSEAELRERDLASITHPDERVENMRMIDRLIAGEEPYAIYEKRYIHKNGSPVWVQASVAITRDGRGRPVGIVGLVQDISERRHAEHELRTLNETLERRVSERTEVARLHTEELARSEAALHRQKRLLELVLDGMGDGVVSVDENMRFQLFTRAAEQTLGKPPLDLPPEKWAEFFGFYQADQKTRFPVTSLPLWRAIKGESVDDAEIFVRSALHPNGRWISSTTRPIFDEVGHIRGAVAVVHDLTDRKHAESMLREGRQHFQELAEHSRRLVRELAHRVRNNIAALLGLVTVMRHRAPDVQTFADAMEGRLSAMAHVDHLLSRSGWQPVDLRSLIVSSLATMHYMAPHSVPEMIEGPDVQIPPRCVLPLTLILFEWFVNSCKHGVHHAGTGQLRTAWELVRGTDQVHLTWEESGGPLVRQPVVASLGTELVHAFATRELRGRCKLNFPSNGAFTFLNFQSAPSRPD